jgi:PAS domain S-box-containing protein
MSCSTRKASYAEKSGRSNGVNEASETKRRRRVSLSLRIALIYALAGALWIFFSDKILSLVANPSDLFTKLAMIKGWAYVAVTAVLLYVLVNRSMLQLERSEQALCSVEDECRQLLEIANSIIIRVDPRGRVIFINEFAQHFFGYKPREILEKQMRGTIVQEKDSPGHGRWPELPDVLDHPEKYSSYQSEHVRSNGERVWVAWSTKAIFDSEDRIQEILFIGNDITEQKRAEQALTRSEERLRIASEASGVGMWHWDMVNNELEWTEQCKALFGLPPDAVITYADFLDLVHPDDREQTREAVNDSLEKGRDYASEYRVIRPDGTLRWILARGLTYRDGSGNPVRMLGAVMDVTERRRIEETLRASHDELGVRVKERTEELAKANAALQAYAARLETLNKDLQEFAFVASHDLAEPLRKIKSFAARLKTKYEPLLGAQGCDYLARMGNAADRMQALLHSLLSYSRVTTKADAFVETDLMQVAGTVVSDLEIVIERSGAEVRIRDLPKIRADTAQMHQLLQNLLGNAIKYSRADVKPVVNVHGKQADGKVQILVEDNGIGFDETHLDLIFKPFQRLHGRSSQYEGSGMGLAICHKIVERHGGSITARSKPGAGSTFIVTLPLHHPDHAAPIP